MNVDQGKHVASTRIDIDCKTTLKPNASYLDLHRRHILHSLVLD
jgi:hypothetical protein